MLLISPVAILLTQQTSPRLPSTPHSRSEVREQSFSFVAQSRWSKGQQVSEARSLADEMMFSLDMWLPVSRASRCPI
jgi:hypothetical protein